MPSIRTDGSRDRDSDADRWITRWFGEGADGLAAVGEEDPPLPPRLLLILVFLLCVEECDRYDMDGGCGMFSSSASAPEWEEVARAGSRSRLLCGKMDAFDSDFDFIQLDWIGILDH